MKNISKYMTAAAGAAMMAVTAAPADAQYYDRYDRYDRDRGIDAGDIITGVAILGGIAAITGAFNRDRGRYGYDNRYRYRDDYRTAVNSCGYQAQRYARGGQIRVTDIDRRSRGRYRVEGVIEAGYGNYGSYNRYDRYDRYDRYNRYDRNDRYGRYDQRIEFECTADQYGRITDFDVDRRRY